jgi:carbamoyl-phosphate synthase small subunit
LDTEPNFVSIDRPKSYHQKYSKTIILVDCGVKENILRSLLTYPAHIKRVPRDYDFTRESYDAVLLSNGPGDPTDYIDTIKHTKKALKKSAPVFGICLGSQIMGLAAGASTYKLRFGHRGHNQPCMDTANRRCYITSQNHGYAIDEKSLPKQWKVIFRNLNDNSIEGIEHVEKPFFSVQFHPEACPGPTDTNWLFNKFFTLL